MVEPQEVSMASNKRDQLLNTAENLFYREGYHATGIDRILAESGVAKMTLYKHFKSKDELILAVLDARHELMLTRLRERAARLPPREALLGIFDGLHGMIHGNDAFCGCLFINAAAEYHDRDHPIHRRSSAYKAELLAYLRELLERLNAPQPLQLARQLQYLLEGALSMVPVHQRCGGVSRSGSSDPSSLVGLQGGVARLSARAAGTSERAAAAAAGAAAAVPARRSVEHGAHRGAWRAGPERQGRRRMPAERSRHLMSAPVGRAR